ncbi:MAG: hypothetical protein AAB393_12265, partial [Bacteroidota bacterium]
GDKPDNASPLAPVVAYGMVETTRDQFSITVREYIGRQIDVEIVSMHGDEIPDHYEERRRWAYSTWEPGMPSPATGESMREVPVGESLVLGIAVKEKRVLLHDGGTGMNHLIPITSFYNELMLHQNIRDPKIALNSNLFFQNLASYGDEDIRHAFIAYNKSKRRVTVVETPHPERKRGMPGLLTKFVRKKKP